MKPITPEAVQKEIDHIKGVKATEKLLTIKCFGNFEVLYNGEILLFKRKKAKEFLAVLQHDTPYYRIDTNLVRCDYLSFLENGKPEFHGEYMTQYSWAEATCAMLQFKK